MSTWLDFFTKMNENVDSEIEDALIQVAMKVYGEYRLGHLEVLIKFMKSNKETILEDVQSKYLYLRLYIIQEFHEPRLFFF